jgi:hypothetical protein
MEQGAPGKIMRIACSIRRGPSAILVGDRIDIVVIAYPGSLKTQPAWRGNRNYGANLIDLGVRIPPVVYREATVARGGADATSIIP